ncbi:hypothetical protein XA68_10999 [Ophiocordyceps unilateralis]|uniref:Fork-head domain-containing protein n=1 Tax=Ophiocordyceps unilateralis TaxID=268505 RepID=A0A2A9PR15_OPHUN|nr:hypothetical protein XA68_10999 [Ophiocordyceps unilateralis]
MHMLSGGVDMLSPLASSRMGSGDHHYIDVDASLLVSPAMDEQERVYSSNFYSPAICYVQPHGHTMSGQSVADSYAFMAATQSCLLVKSEHQTLPSPPLAPGDLHGSHDYQDLPMGVFHTDYPVSPEAWSPVASTLVQAGHELDGCQGADELLSTTSQNLPAGLDSFPGLDPMSFGLSMDPAFCVLSPDELVIKAPMSLVTPKSETSPARLDDVPEMQPPCAPRPVKDGNKLDEPYAQLIYRAFMSQPDHAMTLQDIYQWFRDNTNKAVTEKGGWQNSIRHNLSMNAAFTKRHRKGEGGDFRCLMEDAKRTNEWVLEDWAVCYGVQSTTRYRKGNPRRRTGTRSTNHEARQRTQHSAKRAVSGRKGGCAARDSRLRDRSCHRRRSSTARLSSPPRSIMPELYSPESFAVSQAVYERARTIHRGQQMLRPQGAAADFGMLTLTSSTTAPATSTTTTTTTTTAVDQDACAASYSFPYAVRDDAHVAYNGDQLCVDTAYDWSDSGGA